MARKIQHMTINQSNENLLAAERHVDWKIKQEQGRNRNGRAYLQHTVTTDRKKKSERNACRNKVDY
jgi:hypothetical protein